MPVNRAFRQMSLDGVWSLAFAPRQAATPSFPKQPERSALPAKVPGDVLLDLIDAGLIGDPMIGDNAKHCAWVGEKEWWYSRDIEWCVQEGERVELVFDGLSCVADIWLDGIWLGRSSNMFRSWRFDITKQIASGTHRLEVRTVPFDEATLEIPVVKWFETWSDGISDKRYCVKRGASRKAAYSFGWDWAQGLPSCGIWRGVRLETTPVMRIADFAVKAEVDGSLELLLDSDSVLCDIKELDIVIAIREKRSGTLCLELKDTIVAGPGCASYSWRTAIAKPRLWHPAGAGGQFLYEAEISLLMEGGLCASRKVAFGIRSVELEERRLSDTQGTFAFKVNGRSLFLQGANWIPPDIIPARATDELYEKLVRECAECGMNYLRFWGGGFYAPERFYELCDELGILVWQDLMHAGMEEPDFNAAFVRDCLLEAREIIIRLRNHPSILCWCGSNESDIMNSEERQRQRPHGRYYGYRLVHEFLPPVFEELDPGRKYIPSCPTLGSVAPASTKLSAFGFGTTHSNFFQLYEPDDAIDGQTLPCFVNEAYATSPMLPCSLRKSLTDEQLADWRNPVFSAHNFMDLRRGNATLFSQKLYFHSQYRFEDVPNSEKFEAYHETHCEFMKHSVEFLRRHRDVCAGYAFWMFDSAATVMDLSLVDYYGVRKPAFYAFKRANASILPIIARKNARLEFHWSNGSPESVAAELEGGVSDFFGRSLLRRNVRRKLQAEKAEHVFSLEIKELPADAASNCFAWLTAKLPDGRTFRNHIMLGSPRECRFPTASIAVEPLGDDQRSFRLAADCFVRNVQISPQNEDNAPDDNFFDLLPGEEKTITFPRPVSATECKVEWSNNADFPWRIIDVKQECEGTIRKIWTLYNGSSKNLELAVSADVPPELLIRCPPTLLLPPHGVAQVPFEFGANLDAPPSEKTDFPIDIHIGGQTILDLLYLPQPFTLAEEGSFTYTDLSGKYCNTPVQFNLRFQTRDLSQQTETLELMGNVFQGRFSIPEDALPYTFELFGKGKLLGRPPGGGQAALRLWNALPTKEFCGKDMITGPLDGKLPDLLNASCGVLLRPGKYAEVEHWEDISNAQAKLYWHTDGETLRLDLFTSNIPGRQKFTGEDVWKDSCIELVLGTADNRFVDYSFALTERGPEIFLRRSRGSLRPGKCPVGELLLFRYPESNICSLHWQTRPEEIGIPALLAGDSFRFALVLRGPAMAKMSIFNGVNLIEPGGVTKAGTVKIMRKGGGK